MDLLQIKEAGERLHNEIQEAKKEDSPRGKKFSFQETIRVLQRGAEVLVLLLLVIAELGLTTKASEIPGAIKALAKAVKK